jgi:hypothetical protein
MRLLIMAEKEKICKKHGKLSTENIKTGIYKSKRYYKCRLCEIERSRKYYSKMYQNPDFIIKKHEMDRLRWIEKKEEISEKRKTPEIVQKRKKSQKVYYNNNRKYYLEKQSFYKKNLSDCYVKKIIQNNDKSIKFSQIPKELVELKISLILFKKGIKNKSTLILEEKNNEDKEY